MLTPCSPLTTLRDNLVVRLLDAEGSEIALTGIQTMSIVEKVSWDEIFPLDGVGHVHLKLQFILNEEERNRIRLKREAAVKKKQESFSNISHKYPEIASSAGSSVASSPQAEQKVSGLEESIPVISHKYPEIASSVGSSVASSPQVEQKVSDSQARTVLRVASLDNVVMLASLLPNPDVSSAGLQSNYGSEEGSILKQGIPKDTDRREVTLSAPTIHGTEAHQIAFEEKLETQSSRPKLDMNLVSGKKHSSDSITSGSDVAEKRSSASVRLDDDHSDKSQPQGLLEKSPSNVRKLVCAFESSQAKQGVKAAVEVPIDGSEPKKVQKGDHQKDSDPKDVIAPVEPSSGRVKNPFVAGDLKPALETSSRRGVNIGSAKSAVDSISNEERKSSEQLSLAAIRSVEKALGTREWMESPEKLERSSTTEQATTSGRMHGEQPKRVYSFKLFSEKRSFGGPSYVGGKGRDDSSKIDIQVASYDKSKSLEYSEEEHFYSENSGMWIFPNNTKHLCITTAGKRVMNLLGNVPTEAKSNKNKKSSSSSGDMRKQGSEYQRHQKESHTPGKSRSESSSDDASGGFVGRVIKIAIIVGFGVLVFFTRQREPRKSKRDTNELFFATSDYIDEQTTAAEQVN
ncbi:hypothetical protein ACH5RR_004083 [Cinchona calisaya]|uniref:Uncharacterized protein n=1 Tax=Cinchona calisaya TaxID=153742 RepID=A0ABD3AWN3_9GENT